MKDVEGDLKKLKVGFRVREKVGGKTDLLRSVSVNVKPYKLVYQDRYGARITTHRGLGV